MIESSEVRQLCLSISFFFAHLGASLGSFSTHCPLIKGFVSSGSSLGFVLAYLHPLLHQSLNWFKEMVGEMEVVSEVRSSELEMGLSSSDNPIKAEGDSTASSPLSSGQREIRPFHALREECALDTDTLFRFKDSFQFPEEVRILLLREREKACAFSPGEVCFYKAAFWCGLRFLVHPFIMELLNQFNITPGKLMSNSWRIVIRCMEIWMVVTEGNIIRLDEYVHLYCLKKSKEYRYYELVPWVRKARIITDLPSSFWYWKYRYFFVSGDG